MPVTNYIAEMTNQIMAGTVIAMVAILVVLLLLVLAGIHAKKNHGAMNPLIIIGVACLAVGVYAFL